MGLVDVAVLLAVLAGGVAGWRLGFVTRLVSWLLMAIGLVVAVRLLPWVLGWWGGSSGTTATLVAVGVVFAGLTLGQTVGFTVAARIAPRRRGGPVRGADRLAGAVVGAAGVVAVLWLLLPVLASTPGLVSRAVVDSSVARGIDEWLPEPPDAVQGLRVLVGDGLFPDVFEALRPTPDPGPPPASTGIDPSVSATVAAAVVRVEAQGCGRVQNGTGFATSPAGSAPGGGAPGGGRVVVTNAHVVAGAGLVEVEDAQGRYHRASVIAFDPVLDLAVLTAPTLDAPVLGFGTPTVGAAGGAYGHPGGGPLRIAPTRVAGVIDALGRDIYGAGGARREVVELAADLAPGDSGSPVVDTSGSVVGVVFAVATDRRGVGYALAPDAVEPLLAGATGGTGQGTVGVSTGRCLG